MESKVMNEVVGKMDKAVDYVLHEFNSIHTGKASPAMVEGLKVEAYGSLVHLKEIAAITTPDARSISIQPWDKSVVSDVVKAIQKANIGLNPRVDGSLIRCPIPELSRERRQELVKTVHGMAEEGKVRIRGIRRDVLDILKKEEKAGNIAEDDLKRMEKEIQTHTDKHIEAIGKHLTEKEKELMQI
ncbi:MAG: ribosome recycling factor [Verrucomicrobia bacterium]|nr:MAG: ribosome recycling factor [Verrucomicrobiota bacterium]